MTVDREELERQQQVAGFLRAERERYEYLLACAKDAEHEELAWETIVARMAVEDFVTAAKEVLAGRAVVDAAREFLDALAGNLNYHYPPGRADHLSKLVDIAKARRGVA